VAVPLGITALVMVPRSAVAKVHLLNIQKEPRQTVQLVLRESCARMEQRFLVRIVHMSSAMKRGALRNVLTASLARCVLKEGSRTVHRGDTVMEKVILVIFAFLEASTIRPVLRHASAALMAIPAHT